MGRILRLAGWAAVVLGCAAASAPAAEPMRPSGRIAAAYQVTWMGFPVYTARLAAAWDGGRYRMAFRAEAQGIARLGAHTTIDSATRGRFVNGHIRPELFEQAVIFRKRTRLTTIAYGAPGAAPAAVWNAPPSVRVEPPESPGKRPAVPHALKAGTLDPLSATFAAVTAPPGARHCAYAAKVFEGLRRTDLRLEHEGAAPSPVRHAGLAGDSLVCRLHAKRLAGYAAKHFRQNPEPLPPARLWVAKHADSGLWLPVQLRFDSAYGPIYARLVRIDTRPGAVEPPHRAR